MDSREITYDSNAIKIISVEPYDPRSMHIMDMEFIADTDDNNNDDSIDSMNTTYASILVIHIV